MTSVQCLVSRWIAARRLDDGAKLPRWVTLHQAGCPGCRAQHEQQHRVIGLLAAEARGAMTDPSPFLRARILANLDSASATATHFNLRRALGWSLAAAATAAVVLLIQLQSGTGLRRTATPGATHDEVPAGRVVLAGLPGREAVLALGADLDEPLEAEMRLVIDDAQTALTALSRNFLPSDLAGAGTK